jgi:hypothetical protein
MDVYTALTWMLAELLAVSHGLLSQFVTLPSNASGPLDPNAWVTAGGAELAQYLAGAGVNTAEIVCDFFEALF